MFKNEKAKAVISAGLAIVIVGSLVLFANFYKSPVEIPDYVQDGFDYFRDSLKDPDSLVLCGDVIVKYSFPIKSRGVNYTIGFFYNAKNGFGGRNGIKAGILTRNDGEWFFFDGDEVDVPNQKPGQHPLEATYENIPREIEVRQKRLAQIEAGEVVIEESVQKKIEDALDRFYRDKNSFSFYDGKDVAKAIKCEYYD